MHYRAIALICRDTALAGHGLFYQIVYTLDGGIDPDFTTYIDPENGQIAKCMRDLRR